MGYQAGGLVPLRCLALRGRRSIYKWKNATHQASKVHLRQGRFCFRSPLLCLIAKLCTGTWASCPSSVGVQLPGNRLYGSPGQTKQEEEIDFSPVAFDSGDSVIISVWVPTSSQPLVLKAALRAVTSSRFRKCSNNNRRITETQATPRASRVASCSCVWGLFFGG